MAETEQTVEVVKPCGCHGDDWCPQHVQQLSLRERQRRFLARRRERERAEREAQRADPG